ncbi:hypothetical protein LTS10_005246 [Elasticomyces elasticus]|nr:hypothetical protein LTS10_005246 [Elasticomyces elasticus]
MASGHTPGAAVVGTTIAFTVLAAIAVLLRLYTRIKIVSRSGLDDLFISIAMLLSILLTICMCQEVNYGGSRRFATLTSLERKGFAQWLWASIWVYYLALGTLKCSILLQYLRIFPQTRFQMTCYVMLGVVGVYTTWAVFSAIFACTPVALFWNESLHGTCFNRLAVWFSNAVFNITTDIITTVLPLPMLRALRLPQRQRIVLMVVFALGGFSCIVSILRLPSLYAISKATDMSYSNSLAALYSNMEVNIGILCSCIPPLKGLVNHISPKLFRDVRNSAGTANRKNGGQGSKRGIGIISLQEINVVTVLEQEVSEGDGVDEHGNRRDSDSTRKLVANVSSLGRREEQA